ncbi:MAG: hypothetical protein ACWA5K_05750, partial [bacterium]
MRRNGLNSVKKVGWLLAILSGLLSMQAAFAQSETGLYAHQSAYGVHLRWSAPIEKGYGHFDVERREAGGGWIKLNNNPIQLVQSAEQIRSLMGPAASNYLAFFESGATEITGQMLQSAVGDDFLRAMFRLSSIRVPSMAKVLGETFVDTDLRPGKTFEYRVLHIQSGASTEWAQLGAIAHGKQTELPVPAELTGVAGDQRAELNWVVNPELSKQGTGVGFQVYRALQPFGPFEKANIETVIPISFDGSLPESLYVDYGLENGTTYWYHVRGTDVLGFESAPSNAIEVTPGDQTPPDAPEIVSGRLVGDRTFIEWQPNGEDDLLGYRVYRSTRPLDGYERVWPGAGSARMAENFVDQKVEEGTSYWYYVTAVDQSDNESSPSAVIEILRPDTTPPSAPEGLQAAAEEGGIRLTWRANKEPDLEGYLLQRTTRVEQASEGERAREKVSGIFFAVNAAPLKETVYLDAVDETSQARYAYQLVAIDRAGNESKPSVTVIASMPDKVPPDSPTLRSVTQEQGDVILSWLAPIDRDLAGYRVYRMSSEGNFARIAEVPGATALEYRDQPSEINRNYSYRVTALDEVPNESDPSGTLTIRYLDLEGPKPPVLEGEASESEIKLTWIWPKDADDLRYGLLFRKGPDDIEPTYWGELTS